MSDRAGFFCGGGVAGISWMIGRARGLREGGVDLAAADLLSGTSAGAGVATQLATGARHAAAEHQRARDRRTSGRTTRQSLAELWD